MMNVKTTLHTIVLTGLSVLSACQNGAQQPTTKRTNDSAEQQIQNSQEKKKVILFFGDSITAGYGLDGGVKDAFPEIIQQKIDSLNLPYTCVNAGLSGETSAGGLERIDWLLKNEVDIFVLELGANDGLRGVDPAATYKNLKNIITKVKSSYPEATILLAGMMVPPNLGKEYFDKFKAIYPALAKEENVALVPFILDGVAGQPDLNQKDGIHPTAEAQPRLAQNIWTVLEPLL